MNTLLNPYLNFKDNAKEAMDFYHSIFGGKLDATTFKEFNMSKSPADDNKVMHSMLVADNGITFMASDSPDDIPYQPGANVSMSLSGEDETELRGYWQKLSEGGQVVMPLEKSPWGDFFGMFVDKFGIRWMVNIATKK